MRMSQLFSQTWRQRPSTTDIAGHEYLIRAGYVRQHAAGIFSYLHLGQRVLENIKGIMRQEIDAIGGQQITMPIVHPATLWQASGRWYSVDAELGRFEDRNGRSLVLAMTHEEVVTDLARRELQSYRQLPRLVYQIQTKWRDDPRPRAGLIRAREFTMLDGYSFDADHAGLDAHYAAHMAAYERIFSRCQLPVTAVESDVGMMGGDMAHEYMYLTPIGEDTLLLCANCGYQANRQIAVYAKRPSATTEKVHFQMERVEGAETVTQTVTAVVPQGRQVNETKLSNLLKAKRLLSQTAVSHADITVVDDGVLDWSGAVDLVSNIVAAQEGDSCIHCGYALHTERAVEVANIFKLATHFSSALDAYFIDANGMRQPLIMGCYGIGVTRLMACIAEHCHDEAGLVWPLAVAPFQVHLVALRGGAETAAALYNDLQGAGVSVLWDDRDEGAGSKFHDADLIGVPLRLTVGRRSLAGGSVELKWRHEANGSDVALAEAVTTVADWLATAQ